MEIFLNRYTKSYFLEDKVTSFSRKDYEIQDRIGAGGNGVVHECMDVEGNVYAIKFLMHDSKKSVLRFRQEISLLQKTMHPHIIRYVDDGVAEMEDKYHNILEFHFVIMEKADGNLVDFLKKQGKLQYGLYVPQFRGLCEALEELHHFAIHRDIKPENILIKGETWVLSDFGLCEFLDEDEHLDLTKTNEKVGPAFWMSPEAIDNYYFGSDLIGTYSDVFQLCQVFAFVLMRKHPSGIITNIDEFHTTPDIADFLMACLSNNYKNRPVNGHEMLKRYNSATYQAFV